MKEIQWTGSYLSLPSKTVAVGKVHGTGRLGHPPPPSGQGSYPAALSAEGEELGGAGMDKKDCLQCPYSVHQGPV